MTTIAMAVTGLPALYIFLLALGAPLLVWFAFLAGDGGGDGDGGALGVVLSVNTLAFVATFFGATGLVFTAMGLAPIVGLLLAAIVGIGAGAINSIVFSWLRNSEVSSDVPDRDIEGTVARVSVPISTTRRGRIVLDVGGAHTRMTARSVDSDTRMEKGARVVVVGMESNVALVAPIDPGLESLTAK